MDKVPELILGVRALVPGIIVATIFYLYSNTRFDQFFFLVFCIIFVSLTSLLASLVAAFLNACISAIASLVHFARHRAGKPKDRAPVAERSPWLSLPTTPERPEAYFGLELIVAVLLGLLVVELNDNDVVYRIVSRFISTEKISFRETLDYVHANIKRKAWDRLDLRPENKKACKQNTSNCTDDVYIRVRFKDGADIYEGAISNYSTSGERSSLYLSPACVIRSDNQSKESSVDGIPGPGVYVNLADARVIEYIAIRDSRCFRFYYPNFK